MNQTILNEFWFHSSTITNPNCSGVLKWGKRYHSCIRKFIFVPLLFTDWNLSWEREGRYLRQCNATSIMKMHVTCISSIFSDLMHPLYRKILSWRWKIMHEQRLIMKWMCHCLHQSLNFPRANQLFKVMMQLSKLKTGLEFPCVNVLIHPFTP